MKKFKKSLFSLFLIVYILLPCLNSNAKSKWEFTTPQKNSTNTAYQVQTLTKYANNIEKNINWNISRVTSSNAKKDGYKKITFSLEKLAPTDFTTEEIDYLYNIIKDGKNDYGLGWCTIMDGVSGTVLTVDDNDYNVKCTHTEIQNESNNALSTSDRKSYYPYQWGTTYTVVYPEEYDDLCLVIGGYNTIGKTKKSNDNFLKGNIKFSKSSYYDSGSGFYKVINLTKLN